MRRISSTSTWWYKKVFPIFWFGSLVVFEMLIAIFGPLARPPVPVPILLVPVGMAVFGYLLMRWLIFPLVDEVYLSGDEVIVRNRGEETSFPVTNIINVEASRMTNPERITLTLRVPCSFGQEIIFCPPFRWWHFTRHPLADELIRKANRLPPV
jgi:hypothetical protein